MGTHLTFGLQSAAAEAVRKPMRCSPHRMPTLMNTAARFDAVTFCLIGIDRFTFGDTSNPSIGFYGMRCESPAAAVNYMPKLSSRLVNK
jgi:hypothetical protein